MATLTQTYNATPTPPAAGSSTLYAKSDKILYWLDDLGVEHQVADSVAVAAAQAASQPLDTDLTAIAALTTTAFGRAFLTLATAGATRVVLGFPAAVASGGAAPVGGVGTAAGGWDTAVNRDAAITLLNNIRTALIANGILT
jgi:hypothetical protein